MTNANPTNSTTFRPSWLPAITCPTTPMTTDNFPTEAAYRFPLAIQSKDLTFGVEIETHISGCSPMPVAGYYNRSGVTVSDTFLPAASDGSRWQCKDDGSIRVPNYNRQTAEFVSPILKGADGMRNLVKVVKTIKARTTSTVDGRNGLGAKINASCGIHVHVGFPTNDLKALQRLISLVAGYEKGIYAATGTKARERGTWCPPVKDRDDIKNANKGNCRNALANAVNARGNHARYIGLNLTNLLNGVRPAVEFRFFSGSLNPTKIAAFVSMAIGMVQLAMSMAKVPNWDSKAAGAAFGKNAGQGEREVKRLMRRLEWIGKPKWLGALGMLHDGNPGLPTKRAMVKVLTELGAKYDAS